MARQALIILAVVVVFGVLVPWNKGLDFIDPVILVVYACMSLLFVGPAAAEVFGDSEPVMARAEIVSRLGMILLYGWGTSFLMLASGIVTVNATHWHGTMMLPPAALLISALLLSLTASIAVISGTALMARRFGPPAAKTTLRFALLILLLTVGFGFRYLPPEVRRSINRHLTTSGIEQFSFIGAAVFALAALVLTARLLKPSASEVIS